MENNLELENLYLKYNITQLQIALVRYQAAEIQAKIEQMKEKEENP